MWRDVGITHNATGRSRWKGASLSGLLVFALLSSLIVAPSTVATAMTTAEEPRFDQRATLVAPEGVRSEALVAPAATGDIFAHGMETWPGQWTMYGTPSWGQTSYRANEGSYSAYCVGDTIAAPGPYVDNTNAWMVAGPFDLSALSAATLSFDFWLNSEDTWDYLWIGASTDAASYRMVGTSGNTGGWVNDEPIDLATDFRDEFDQPIDFTGEPEVWIAFAFQSDELFSDYEGAYIDDVRVIPGTAATGDAYEPDDSYGAASPITVNGAAQQHTIDPAGDVDFVSFSAVDGWTYEIETAEGTPANTLDTELELYDSNGTTLLDYDDDGGVAPYSYIAWTANASRTVYVRVNEYGNDETGSYALTVTGTAPAPNTAPIAKADSYSTNEGVKKTVAAPGVLGNDTDADDDSLTAHKLTSPSHGTVSLSTSGGFTYTPNAGFFGTDSFTYRAYDGEDYSGSAKVTITVNEVIEPLPPVLEVEGANRYVTAVEASKLAYPNGASTVVIATGQNWPDALGGSALAGALDGPILLTDPGSLNPATLAEIKRLKATSAVILGGTAAVSTATENSLRANLKNVSRIAGTNRYETANRVAVRVTALLGAAYDGTAFVSTGANFPDALAAAPLAAANKWPLYLVDPAAGLTTATRNAMKGVDDVLILGGTAVVSPTVETALRKSYSVTRLAGSNRYSTAVAVATHGVNRAGLDWDRVGFATGENYPDALAGGVLQGKAGSVMLLTPTASLCNEAGTCVYNHRAAIDTVTFFGGTSAISAATRQTVIKALAGVWNPDPGTEPTDGIDGVWHGIINGSDIEGVTLNVKNGKITQEGSTLANGASMIVTFPYLNVTITNYVYDDIPITNNAFAYSSGSISLPGGLKTVRGTFASGSKLTGSASHNENSFSMIGSMDYDWTATR